MPVTLRELTLENVRECCALELADDQVRYVAPNAISIAESKVAPYLVPRAVYDGDTMVGFTLYGHESSTGRFYVVRLMIDRRYQRRGYGSEAMRLVVDELARDPACDAVYLSYVPENEGAARLYRALGFEATGEVDEDGEVLMRLMLPRSDAP
jgi:diamine N-acetyltransferase